MTANQKEMALSSTTYSLTNSVTKNTAGYQSNWMFLKKDYGEGRPMTRIQDHLRNFWGTQEAEQRPTQSHDPLSVQYTAQQEAPH